MIPGYKRFRFQMPELAVSCFGLHLVKERGSETFERWEVDILL